MAHEQYNPATASLEEYEAAYDHWQELDDAYYSGDSPTPPGRPPRPPEGIEDRQSAVAVSGFLDDVEALYPWMPRELAVVFAEAWAESGDEQLALAEMRQSDAYDRHFAGNRRDDGSFRMSEQEYIATKDAYRTLLSDFGLNPDVFSDRLVGLIEGEVSPNELAGRLGAAYEGIVTSIPQVREFYAREHGIELSDQAIFATFIDPNIGDAILNRRISVAQVGGEGLARGFDVGLNMAQELADAGVDQQSARQFFSQAQRQIPLFERLAQRHNDPDDTFDLGEFADLAVFQDPEQARRVDRLLASESSLFTEQLGAIATSDDLRITGLRTL